MAGVVKARVSECYHAILQALVLVGLQSLLYARHTLVIAL